MMTDSIKRQLDFLNQRKHREHRRELTSEQWDEIAEKITDKSLSYMRRNVLRLELFLEHETPVILENTKIHGLRTLIDFPDIYAEGELDEIRKTHFIHEKGKVTNLAWDCGTVLSEGLEGRRKRLMEGKRSDSEFVICANRVIDATIAFSDRYADKMDTTAGTALRRAIRTGCQTMTEALQVFRILHFTLWAAGNYHNTVGRFDQWIYPFYEKDLKNGVLTDDGAFELIEDFFLSFNRDSDLYYSLAWGDNGQSLVLGGMLPDGTNGVNRLTEMCLRASLELRQIDPKINLRVDINTPVELFELGSELTKAGLGFPQYSNDDVVIPGLIRLGYAPEHARDYVMAACWEFIIPKVAMDIPNIGAMPLAQVVNDTIRLNLKKCKNIEELLGFVEKEIRRKAADMAEKLKPLYIETSPFQSILMEGCLEKGEDISNGLVYNNYGFHGTGFSCAVDQLAAVDSLIFKTGKITSDRLLKGLESNFENDRELRHILRNDADKIGRDENARVIGNHLLDIFAKALECIKNERGGIFRAGTGSAMYYIWHSKDLPATADGRDAGQLLPANFSPSLFLTGAGPFSVMSGFAFPSIVKAVNGGPLTFELHDSVFNHPDSVKKVALLVRSYILAGGHQLQINAVNREKMIDAQKNPDKHKDLIVRVWGWSGHFVELDKCYQDHVISRAEFSV